MWLFPHMTKVTCLHSHNFMKNEESQFFNLNSEEELENVWSDLFLKILEFLKNSQNANVEETKRLKI